MLREWLLTYFARPLTRLIMRLAALPALRFCSTTSRRSNVWTTSWRRIWRNGFAASLLLLLVTANMEVLLWHPLIPFPDLMDEHKWFGVGLRIMLAIAVVQLMPDQELFTVIHPGPRIPRFPPGTSLGGKIRLLGSRCASVFSGSTSADLRRSLRSWR